MGQREYLTDTNVIIDYLGKRLPPKGTDFMNGIIDAIPNISVISKIELLGFNTTTEHTQLLLNFIGDATVLDLDNTVVDISITIRNQHTTKLPDAIIAATALAYNMTLITRNVADFKNIEGLEVIDPHSL